MDLALQQHRVHHRADIVDDHVALDLDGACLGVDLDLGGMAAIGEGRHRGHEDAVGHQPRLDIGRQQRAHEGGLGDFLERLRLVGAGDAERAVAELDVLDRGLEEMRGNRLALFDDLLAGGADGGAADAGRARAEGAVAEGDLVGVALQDADLIEVQAEDLDQKLAEHRLVALAMIVRADHHRGAAARIEADLGIFLEAAGRLLDRVGETEAA